MSIMNAIANCRKTIGSGMDRNAYYSKKYNLVIKRSRRGSCYDGATTDSQTLQEREFFLSLNDDERKFFPVIDYVQNKRGQWICLMHRCIPIMKYGDEDTQIKMEDLYDEFSTLWKISVIDRICETLGLSKDFNADFLHFIKVNQIDDTHFYNVGIWNGHLVLMDCGFAQGKR